MRSTKVIKGHGNGPVQLSQFGLWVNASLGLCIAVAFLSLFTPACSKTEEVVSIGALLPLTGPGANYGVWERQGIDLAVEEINADGGVNGKKLKIIYEDVQSNPQIAVSAFKKLLAEGQIQAAVAGISSVVLALAPIADSSGIVLVNCGGISPRIPEVTGNYVYSNIVDGSVEVKAMADFAVNRLKFSTIGVLYINSAAGVDAKDVFAREYESKGGKVVTAEAHEPGATDFRTQLTKLQAAGPQAVYLASFTKESALILKQAKELGFRTQWLSYAPFEGEDIFTVAGSAAEEVIYTSQAFDPLSADPRIRGFQEKYRKKYGTTAEIYAATFYDGIYMLADSMRRMGTKGTQIREGLRTIGGFQGVTGEIRFDARQVVSKPIVFKVVREGRFQMYTPPSG